MKNKLYSIALFLVPVIVFALGLGFEITLAIIIIAGVVLLFMKRMNKMDVFLAFALFFTFSIAYFFYFSPSVAIAEGQGTVLSDNWWEALNWIKNNTAACAPVATYWDPGHFITGIAERPVVFDGASQGATRTIEVNGTNVTTARIQDIATSLYTTDEEKAVELMKKYRNGNCSEFYYIASSDLIYKSVWWSYFATWDPAREGEKGDKYSYIPAQVSERMKPLLFAGVVGYEYSISGTQSFIIYEKNGTLSVVFQQDNQFIKVRRFVIARSDGYVTYEDPSAEIPGTIYSPGFPSQIIFYMPSQLQDSMFTKLYFFNGAGLKHFKYINNWGGEVKLFSVDFASDASTNNASTPPVNSTSAADTTTAVNITNNTVVSNFTNATH